MKSFIIFFVNKFGLYDFAHVRAIDLEDALLISELFSKTHECKVLGVCFDCFKSFKLDV